MELSADWTKLLELIQQQLRPEKEKLQAFEEEKEEMRVSNHKISPTEILVIYAILTGVLEVDSICVDRDQAFQVVLEGSFKQKTELDRILDQIGVLPFDDVWKALMRR